MSAEARSGTGWVHPEKEVAVYEDGLFSRGGLPFRPARCYLVSQLDGGLKILWLEDLRDAPGTPFSLGQLRTLADHLGQFNGFHAAHQVKLPFEPAVDSYRARWTEMEFQNRLARTCELRENIDARRMYGAVSVDAAMELHELLDQLVQRSPALQHSLSFGDCQIGNLFALENETVAIDWASLTFDPTGVDAGCLIGSAMLWGKRGGEIAEAEQDLFQAYKEGLTSGGWTGNSDDIRRGFFGQFGTYLMGIATVPASMSLARDGNDWIREFAEKRFEAPFEEIPDLLAPVISRIPSYVEEVSRLLE